MAGLRMLLDPGKAGPEGQSLEKDLRSRIVGQEEAIRQIVDVYQTYMAGMSSPGGRPEICSSSAPPGRVKRAP